MVPTEYRGRVLGVHQMDRGFIPVGGYMVIHLAVNASVLNSPASFQSNVANIHKFGALLPVLEWTLIFLPILFHAIVGMVIVAGALSSATQSADTRLQRGRARGNR